ncbi:MAG: hypothetical protein HQK75_15645 [Candidatus Magnetomorum sp.]|nr:hypothetical protein [Candidatus Magnetomorum sp.]
MMRYYRLINQTILIVGWIIVTAIPVWCESSSPSKEAYFYPGIEKVGFIRKDSVPFSGSIHCGEQNQVMINWNHTVYITPHRNYVFHEKDRFFVFRNIEDIYYKERSMGTYYQILGVIEITALKPRFVQGIIVKAFLPIRKGDLLKPYEEKSPYVSMTNEVPYIRAHIIGAEESKRMIGQGDIVYIDQGHVHGISSGNVFSIFEQQEKNFEMSSRTDFLDPSQSYPSGQLLILLTERETSAGLITWSKNELLMVHDLDVH